MRSCGPDIVRLSSARRRDVVRPRADGGLSADPGIQSRGRGKAETKDNLERAAKSIGRNLAEGAGKWLLADKINFYQIARGSGTEGARSLDELVDWGLVPPERIVKAKELAWRIVNMLTGIIRKLESLPERENAPRNPSATATARASA